MRFQARVIVIAIIVLIASLTFIGYTLYSSQKNQQFPPVRGECPDYWSVLDTNKCMNTRNLGKCPGTADFSGPYFQGEEGACHKATWARSCEVTWDGITNNPKICDIVSGN